MKSISPESLVVSPYPADFRKYCQCRCIEVVDCGEFSVLEKNLSEGTRKMPMLGWC